MALDAVGAVLLIKRTDTGDWALPGGSAEPGSTYASTSAEELEEETGLHVALDDLEAFASLSDERWTNFTFPNGDVVHSFNLCFFTRRWSGELHTENEEASAVGFFALDELPDPMLPMSVRILELWEKHQTSGSFQTS